MTFRILADENVDHRVVYRLEHYGHDAVHVDLVPELGKGTDDHRIAQHALASDRLILTNDLDFLTDFSKEDYRGVLFITEDTFTTGEITEIVHEISKHIEQEHIEDLLFVSSTWLGTSKQTRRYALEKTSPSSARSRRPNRRRIRRRALDSHRPSPQWRAHHRPWRWRADA